MIKKFVMLMSFVCALTLSSQAIAATTCFNADGARRFRVINGYTVDVYARFGEVYRLQVGFCTNLPWAARISFSRWYTCPGDDLITYEHNGQQDRCWIQDIRRIQ